MAYICSIAHVKEHSRTSKTGNTYTVNAHTRTVCRTVNKKSEFARKKAEEAKPKGKGTLDTKDLLDKFLNAIKDMDVKYTLDQWKKNFRYENGNWFGPKWWGGSDNPEEVGNLPPTDSLDALAMRHDFGYQIAEEYGKILQNPILEQQIKVMVDIIAVRDALNLSEEPKKWVYPPKDIEKAKKARAMLIVGFTGITPTKNHATAVIKQFKKNLSDSMKVISQPIGSDAIATVLTRSKLSKIDPNLNIDHIDKMMDYRVYKWYCKYGK